MVIPQGRAPLGRSGTGSLGERVAIQLRDAIVSGSIGLGEALSEDSLAEALGVSRTPVREALRELQTQGLVEIKPKSGTTVFVPTEEQIAELVEFRTTMELQAANWAFERNRVATADALARAVELMEPAIEAQDMRAFGRADTFFHQAFVDHCDNSYLQATFSVSLAQVAALRTHLAVYLDGEWRHSYRDHVALRDIFVSGRKGDLDELLAAHIARTKGNYTQVLHARYTTQHESRVDLLRRALVAEG
ncbi:GntR family transcriptional regulator [Ruicaihuangia caeni]|uniref:GntR family transcriptional regulator n=1 Tax=Ruicaihuangia caeni TaxID=3042517 RepID=UPI0033901CCB